MARRPRSPSMHNRLLGTRIPHPSSTNFNYSNEDFPSPPSKRIKTDAAVLPGQSNPTGQLKTLVPDSEDDGDGDGDGDEDDEPQQHRGEVPSVRATQLETTLPPVQTDEEAIEAYAVYKAEEQALQRERRDQDEGNMRPREMASSSRGRSSIYVDAFNLALDTVLEEEAHLFDEAETKVFEEWRGLEYESQYLYVRLFLRKTSKWFRVKDLQYYSDITNIDATVEDLQKVRVLPQTEDEVPRHPAELEPPEGSRLGEAFSFAECSSDHITTLDEASSLLLLDELKSLAKEVKVQGKNKRELLHNFRQTSGKQAGLGFTERRRTETEESSALSEDGRPSNEEDENDRDNGSSRQTPTPHHRKNRDAHFTKKILDQTGRCIRLSLSPLKLFERVHLVFYRSTEWTEKSLTTLILAKISRRNFPGYIVSRSTTIFDSRALLLEFEASLRTQFRVDNVLEFHGTPGRKQLEELKTIAFEAVYPRWKALLASEQRKEDRVYESGEGAYLRRFSPAWAYTRIVHKGLHALARFKEHRREHDILTELLDQRLFHAARRGVWYQRKALLEEHYMHTLMPTEGRAPEANKKHWKRVALRTCEQGLEDGECHVIYHYDLQKRIKKLEKQLRVPVREQHDFGHVRLAKAVEREVWGVKIEREGEDTPVGRNLGRMNSVHESDVGVANQKGNNISSGPNTNGSNVGVKTIWLDDHLSCPSASGSSDIDSSVSQYVSVESLALSHYRHTPSLQYKGYHTESGLLRHLFGLLFYDILFFTPYIPNVFQTPYQTCPLDLHTDSFYGARISEINGRINEICNGKALEIAMQTWDLGYEKRLCIVGVKWDEFDKDDLTEILQCWDPNALGTVMRVMAQEYGARSGGVPDLFLWKVYDHHDPRPTPHIDSSLQRVSRSPDSHSAKSDSNGHVHGYAHGRSHGRRYGEVVFVEVKSANDRLSDTQRLWISVLLAAGVKVELCHVMAKEVRMI